MGEDHRSSCSIEIYISDQQHSEHDRSNTYGMHYNTYSTLFMICALSDMVAMQLLEDVNMISLGMHALCMIQILKAKQQTFLLNKLTCC
jgi:hypothetical protein